tara:strand:- start:338 stop:820 length:483 start_codon:yes stop_codon:yes gene_type:complete
MQFQKKDLIDFLIFEIDLLEPKYFYYKHYHKYLLELKEENRQKSLKELIDNLMKFIIENYNKVYKHINIFINNHITKKEEFEYEEDEEDIIIEEDDSIENKEESYTEEEGRKFRDLFICSLKDSDVSIVELFMENEQFNSTKEIIEKSLKRHIIPITKKK